MQRFTNHGAIRTVLTVLCLLLTPFASSLALGQSVADIAPQAARPQNVQPQLLSPGQLDALVAPIALYPDPLLSQVLAASTYPLEIVEAQQWLQQNSNLQGQPLIEAAKRQNWDPSVQMLVAAPDTLAFLSRDIRWTTDLGNAFLVQQADVMDSIQRLRAQASGSGRLTNTPQQIVTAETQGQQSAIQIQPANPQVLYPPVYNPADIWGAPAAGAYPALDNPQATYGNDSPGYGFGNAIDLLSMFSGLLGGWGAWGWALNWFTHALSLSGLFFNSFGSQGGGYGFAPGFVGTSVWMHDPAHRLGIHYSRGFVPAGRGFSGATRSSSAGPTISRFSNSGFAGGNGAASFGRSPSEGWRTPGSSVRASAASPSRVSPGTWRYASGNNYAAAPSYRSGFAGGPLGQNSRASENTHAFANPRPQQAAPSTFRNTAQYNRAPVSQTRFTAPQQSSQRFSTPRVSASHFSPPKAPKQHFSAPRRSSGGGHSSHSGGGHSSKGSHKR